MSTFANSEDPDEYSKMLHFIRVYTVCKGKKDLQTNEYNIFSSPEPLAHGELLWSMDVRRASSTIGSKDIS